MPKNNVTGLITDQEISFARLVLAGTMTDRQAAEAVGLNPDAAAYTKAKPRVRAYMLEHRAAAEQKLAGHQAELSRLAVEELNRQNQRREQVRERVLDRLWELADLSSEATRNSISGQVKAISLIVAIEGLIPDRRAAEEKSAPAPIKANIYQAPWVGKPREQDTQEEVAPAPPDPRPVVNPAESTFADRFTPAGTQWVPDAGFAPDTRDQYSDQTNRFGRRR